MVQSANIIRKIFGNKLSLYACLWNFGLLFIAGCHSEPVKNYPIKIAINPWPGYAHVFIAQEKGFFKKNGVKVDLIFNQTIPQSLEQFKQGSVDGMFNVFSEAIVLDSKGILNKVVYISDYSESGDVLLGQPELKSVEDLEGKTVSFEGVNSFSHLFILLLLQKAGIPEYRVKFVNISAKDVLTALNQKKIDAGHSWEPITQQALNSGYKILGSAKETPGLIADVLMFSSEIVQNRKKEVQAIIQSLFEARMFYKTHQKEAISIMANAEEMSEEEMLSGIQGVHILSLDDNEIAMTSLDNPLSLFVSGKMISQFFLDRGQFYTIPDLGRIIEPRFIQRLKGSQN